jgi:hypothetical protein
MPMATKEAQREYQRNWVRRRRNEYFKDKSCARCESVERLELDHKDPSTKVSHSIWSWKKERRDEELLKCQVLCHDCHVVKSVENGDHAFGERHGSSVLTVELVREIRIKYQEGVDQYSLAREYDVGQRTVSDLINRITWRFVV